MNLEEYVRKATTEAFKQHIKANTVLLNKDCVLVKRSYFKYQIINADSPTEKCLSAIELPPMICGLAAHLTDELPDDVAFAVCRTDVETSLEKARREAKQELLDEMKTMQLGEILDLINSEPI